MIFLPKQILISRHYPQNPQEYAVAHLSRWHKNETGTAQVSELSACTHPVLVYYHYSDNPIYQSPIIPGSIANDPGADEPGLAALEAIATRKASDTAACADYALSWSNGRPISETVANMGTT